VALFATACIAVLVGAATLVLSPASEEASLQQLDRADGQPDGPSAYWLQSLPRRLWPKKSKKPASAVLQYVQKLEQHPPTPFWRVHQKKSNLPELVLERAKKIRSKAKGPAIWHDAKLLQHRENLLKAKQMHRMATELLDSAKNEGVLAKSRLSQAGHLMMLASKFGARAEELKVDAQLKATRQKASTMMLASEPEYKNDIMGPQVTKKQVDDAAKAYKEAMDNAVNYKKQAASSALESKQASIRSDQERAKAKEDAEVESTEPDVVKALQHKLASEKQTKDVAGQMQDAKIKDIVMAGSAVRQAREESQLKLAEYKEKNAKEYTKYAASLNVLADQDAASADQLSHVAADERRKSLDYGADAEKLKLDWQEKSEQYRDRELAQADVRKTTLMQLTQANQALRSSTRARQKERAYTTKATKVRQLGEQSLDRAKQLYTAAVQLRQKATKLEAV